MRIGAVFAVTLLGSAVACSSDHSSTSKPHPEAGPSSGGSGAEREDAASGGNQGGNSGSPTTGGAAGEGGAGGSGGSETGGSETGGNETGGSETGGSGNAPGDSGPDANPSSDGGIVLVGSNPPDGFVDVPRSTWVRLDFSHGQPSRMARTARLDCGSGTPEADVHVAGTRVVVNPRGLLPANARCTVTFESAQGTGRVAFTVAPPTDFPAIVPYDRNDTALLSPLPDDYYLVPDPSTRTGRRLEVLVPTVPSLAPVFSAAIDATRKLDGQSPIAPIVVTLPAAVARDTVPLTARESLDPLATVGLFDVDPTSEGRGQRVPFDLLLRNDEADRGGSRSHTLVAFPSVPLKPRGRYAFVVTNRALVSLARPLQASPFLEKVMAGAASTDAEKRLEPIITALLPELERTSPPLRADDLALVLGISVRSTDSIGSDLLAVREATEAAPPPAFSITSVAEDTRAGSAVAAIVEGTWSPLTWTTDGRFVNRDGDGKPKAGPVAPVPFTLALPKRASGAAPLVMYQHFQPGSAKVDVPEIARDRLAAAGFAVIGFTDMADRLIIPDGNISKLNQDVFGTLLSKKRLPDYLALLTNVEQLGLLRLIPTLGAIDVLPIGAPDGNPDLDVSQPLGYLGIDHGAATGAGLLAVAPQIRAAALAVGGGRFIGWLIHSGTEALYGLTSSLFGELTHPQFYAGLSLLQMGYDDQDSMNLAGRVFRQPLPGLPPERASILMAEGLGDSFIPAYSVRSTAAALGIPQLDPPAEAVPFLSAVRGPVRGNLNASTTGGLAQFVPFGYGEAGPTASCSRILEGNDCARRASEAVQQRVDFFTSALTGVPTINYAR